MTVRYHLRKSGLWPNYLCQRQGIEHAEGPCQNISGGNLDAAIGALLLEMLTPVALDVAVAVQEALQQRLEEADHLRRQQVERARYEADLARQRFVQVDPNNRFVADALEADWNEKLRTLTEAQEHYERQRQADRVVLDEPSRAQVLALATNFPKVWHDPQTPDRERKRMVRLLIEDVTLTKGEQLTAQVRFKGGATRTLNLPSPRSGCELWQTSPEVIAEVDRLLDHYTDGQIAPLLTERGWLSGKGRPFTRVLVANLRRGYQLKSRFDRLREKGMLTQEEVAEQLGITKGTVQDWRRCGLLKNVAYNDKNGYLYEPVGPNGPIKWHGVKKTDPRRLSQIASDETKGVQDEA